MALLAGAGAMIGHLFPVWLGFKGGKGVATALGVLLAIAWPVGLPPRYLGRSSPACDADLVACRR